MLCGIAAGAMNKEIHHEGWLIKSPPTKRIWRARWRKRWFTLKQGEIPGQFCLEYYTNRNCRKLKGVIDLDQCEQVDSGLHLEHRKQKFQFMFDIKTPRRTYYLAADTESDMRDWVNCICQVCNLHDFTKQPGERQYYNLCENNTQSSHDSNATSSICDSITDTTQAKYATTEHGILQSSSIPDLIRQTEIMELSAYQNNDFHYVNTNISNRETLTADRMEQKYGSGGGVQENNNATLERTQSLRSKPITNEASDEIHTSSHNRSQSLVEPSTTTKTVTSSTGVIKKIPENLVLSDTAVDDCLEPSPALSTCSGPYIPISECFSGSKFMTDDNPTTPLNNLDPKFYDTPRSHKHIGLNLTINQCYSPKIYNCPQQVRPRSGRSSPTDSESVFTDDEDCSHSISLRESADRNPRPSDSSIENEAIVFTYKQRFSKIPGDSKGADGGGSATECPESVDKLVRRRNHLVLSSTSEDDKSREIIQLSDTENTSPAIGPKDATSCVEESYDIPRSHNLPYYNLNPFNQSLSPTTNKDLIRSSTPNLNSDSDQTFSPISSKTLPRPHFYSNAAPSKTEGNVFRYDFIEQQPDAPAVNRSLKPKLSGEEKIHFDEAKSSVIRPPSVDRKLKPMVFKESPSPAATASLRRTVIPKSLVMSCETDFTMNHKEFESRTLPRHTPTASRHITQPAIQRNSTATLSVPSKSNADLQYLELDVSNPPPRVKSIYSNSTSASGDHHPSHSSLDLQTRTPLPSGVEYKSVDFVKTEAFKRVKEDAEKNRMKD